MDDERLTTLIESSDLDGLVRFIDGLVVAREWDAVEQTRDRCREAVERGKQVWGPAEYAEYRLALEAPAERAASVVGDGKGRYGPGPLWEVAASTHRWDELEGLLETPTVRAMVAHERALRGDVVKDDAVDPLILEIPVAPRGWEPTYPVAVYRSDGVDFPTGERTELGWEQLDGVGERLPDDAGAEALLELVKPWWDESSGHADAVVVSGTARQAIRAIGPTRVRIAEVPFQEALAAMVWAAASGGAYGSRRGTPRGRALVWWAVAQLLDRDSLPEDPDDLAEGEELIWYLWDPGDQVGGWSLHLAVEDPQDGVAWALSAVDMR
jgi:hypothetical protein